MLTKAGCHQDLAKFIADVGAQKSNCDGMEGKSSSSSRKRKNGLMDIGDIGERRILFRSVKKVDTDRIDRSGSRGRTALLKLLKAANFFDMQRLVELATACLACYLNMYLPAAANNSEFGNILCSNIFAPTTNPISIKSGFGRTLGKWLSQPALNALYTLSLLPDKKYLFFDDSQLRAFKQIVLEFMVFKITNDENLINFEKNKYAFKNVSVIPKRTDPLTSDPDFSNHDSIVRLKFGNHFNKKVQGLGTLRGLRLLEFGNDFDQELPGLSKLTSLEAAAWKRIQQNT